jgi:DNA-directed RNA polymerase specialized sigma24 family protein
MEKWVISAKKADFRAISEKFGIDPVIARIIRNRDVVGDDAIDEFLNGLGEINRMIFVRTFWYMDSYKEIANASRLKEGAVRVRMVRVKSDLKEFLKEKGIAV